ncbi:MAG: 23S rRNA (uracil(1939)-C(5))-methyltransferase RlmD [Lactobacillus sp.]
MPQTTKQPAHHTRDVIIAIKRLGINGEGIGYYKKKIIFIPKALPEEVVVAKITAEYPRYLEGELVRIKEKSPQRVPFPKNVNPAVGGLELAHLSYPAQLAYKKDNLVEALNRYRPRGYQKYKIKATIAAPTEWGYRNKASYQLEQDHKQTKLGLYAPNSHDLLDLPVMPTQSDATQAVERAAKALIERLQVPIANKWHHRDGVKTVVVREAISSGEIQVTLITIGHKVAHLPELATELLKLKGVVSVYQNENDWQNPQLWGNKTEKLAGQNQIIETMLGKKFALSPRAFFQLNPAQTVNLYQVALKYLDLQSDMTLIDAYAGVGTLGILASDRVKQVVGIESIPEAVADAQHNVALNHIKNADYVQGNVDRVLPELQAEGLPIDALIVDPPRTGLAKSLIKTLLRVKPKTFVYISCNPSTLAQDLILLTEAYDVRVIQNVDMLPQTPRCECVVKLVRR